MDANYQYIRDTIHMLTVTYRVSILFVTYISSTYIAFHLEQYGNLE